MQSYPVSFSDTQRKILQYSVGMPHNMFEAYADRFPESLAVIGESGTLTYAEVEGRANRIAHALRASGVQKGDLVAIFLERGPDLVCAMLGVLKSGAAFATLDPRAPGEALRRIFATLDCPFLLTRRALMPNLPPSSARSFFLDDAAWLASQPASRPAPRAERDDPACVLFTSGSAGQPKAVLYLHRNLTARFLNSVEVSGLDRSGVFAQTSPVTSIDAMDEIFLPLASGGCTVILSYETVTNPHQLIDLLFAHQVTHMLLVPSLLRVILSAEENLERKLSALKTWMVGGEPLTAALTREFYRTLPGAVLINYYGLTEGDAAYHITSPETPYTTNVPIGRPVRNAKIYLLDEHLSPVPAGKAGEICVAGEGLFHAYVNCPELNAERWITNPFEADPAYARLFRTGDLGRYRDDGEIEYLGRRDRMVKIRGFRVELGEVETTLAQHPAVRQCAVVATHPAGNGSASASLAEKTHLVAYATLQHGQRAAAHELREFLRSRLPDFAVPSAVLLLDSMPLTPNGKVDVLALSKPGAGASPRRSTGTAARDALEQSLARMWEDLLDRHPIGVTDNFFELGGDSLTAIDLMLRIEKEFKCRLPITVLFQSPTIAALAELIRGKPASQDSLVPLRIEGSRPPLFCVHADGSVFIYRHFDKYLEPDIPVYGLQAHGLANPKDEPYKHIDEMAAHYIAEIRTVQPHGPYHLCAFSAGGLIILEMARQLRNMGETVAFVGMLDAYGPGYPERLAGKNVADYKIAIHLNTLRLLGARSQFGYLWGRTRHRTGLILSRLFAKVLLKLKLPLPGRVRYEYIADLIDRAALLYPQGRSYPGEVTIFYAQTQPEGIKPDPTLGWGSLVSGDLKIVDVTGTHNSVMMHEPHVAELVRKINDQLNQLQNAIPSWQMN